MTAGPERHFLLRARHASDALSVWLIHPGAFRADEDSGLRGLPAGPGLSAVDMAAACLCCADPIAPSSPAGGPDRSETWSA